MCALQCPRTFRIFISLLTGRTVGGEAEGGQAEGGQAEGGAEGAEGAAGAGEAGAGTAEGGTGTGQEETETGAGQEVETPEANASVIPAAQVRTFEGTLKRSILTT